MSTMRKYEKPVDQLELTPRVDFSKETLLKPAEAARLLAVRPSWIYDAVRNGRLPAIRVGRHLRFTRAQLEEWVADHGVGGDRRRS
jgi:excisionase family DNA binding protein